jgi:hypothetical protein
MSVYLQNLRTGQYAQGPSQWTDNVNEARNFVGGTAAILFSYLHRLDDVRVLGRFENPNEDFDMPITERSLE